MSWVGISSSSWARKLKLREREADCPSSSSGWVAEGRSAGAAPQPASHSPARPPLGSSSTQVTWAARGAVVSVAPPPPRGRPGASVSPMNESRVPSFPGDRQAHGSRRVRIPHRPGRWGRLLSQAVHVAPVWCLGLNAGGSNLTIFSLFSHFQEGGASRPTKGP